MDGEQSSGGSAWNKFLYAEGLKSVKILLGLGAEKAGRSIAELPTQGFILLLETTLCIVRPQLWDSFAELPYYMVQEI